MPISSVTHLLIHTVTISRLNESDAGKGRWLNNFEPIATDIRGRIWTGSGTERIVGQERKTYTGTVGYFEPTQDIAPQDVVTYNGRSYRVTAYLDPSIAHHRKVALELIEQASL